MATSKSNETNSVIFQQLIEKNGMYYDKHENKPFTGIAFQPHLKDNPFDLSKKTAEKTFLDGKLDGLSTWFTCNGEKKLQVQFKKGKLHGPCEQFIKYGKQTVVKKQRYKNGTLNGVCEWLREDGQLIKRETYVDGFRDGPKTDYYCRGINVNKDKCIKKQGNYSGGMPDGLWQSYYPGNILKSTGFYKMGKRHGPWEWFYQKGGPMNRMYYYYGKLHGPILSFHRNDGGGDIREFHVPLISTSIVETKGMFQHSKREGIWQRFYPDGKIFCKATYKKGIIIESECFDGEGQLKPFSLAISNKRKPYIDVTVNDTSGHGDNCDCFGYEDDIHPF